LHNADAIYDSCGAQMEAVQKEDIQLVIIDMLNVKGTPTMECHKWFGDVLLPGFNKNPNFKGLINVLSASAITKMGANHWKKLRLHLKMVLMCKKQILFLPQRNL
jgi:hypothetical protein